jgi:hypothetical protein
MGILKEKNEKALWAGQYAFLPSYTLGRIIAHPPHSPKTYPQDKNIFFLC